MTQFTAQDAYKLAFKQQSDQMNYVYDIIHKAAENKKFEVVLPYVLIKHLRDRLTNEGYQVQINDRYDGQTVISWWLGDIKDQDKDLE